VAAESFRIAACVVELKYWSCGDYADELWLFTQDSPTQVRLQVPENLFTLLLPEARLL